MKRMNKYKYFPAYIALSLLTLIILVGTIGYMIIEHWSFADSFFMTIITMATVGFGEVHPLTIVGKYFTSILIIISFGIFAYAISTLTRYVVDGVTENYFKNRKVKRELKKLHDHVIVCGYGRNGEQAVFELIEHGIPVVVIEKSEEKLESLKDSQEVLYIQGNATDEDNLMEANISTAKALITTLPGDADNLFVVISARNLKPSLKIISRATDQKSINKLRSAGATNIIMPNRMGGRRMAKLVAQPDVVEFIEYMVASGKGDVKLAEVQCENNNSEYIGKTISDLQVRTHSGANIIGLKRDDVLFMINPGPSTILMPNDKIFILGTEEQIDIFKNLINNK